MEAEKKSLKYWDMMAENYDIHTKRSKGAYDIIIEKLKKEVSADLTILDIGTGTADIPVKLSPFAKKDIWN